MDAQKLKQRNEQLDHTAHEEFFFQTSQSQIKSSGGRCVEI